MLKKARRRAMNEITRLTSSRGSMIRRTATHSDQEAEGISLFGVGDKMAWLAFCSGPYMQQAERKLYPLSPFLEGERGLSGRLFELSSDFFRTNLGCRSGLICIRPTVSRCFSIKSTR